MSSVGTSTQDQPLSQLAMSLMENDDATPSPMAARSMPRSVFAADQARLDQSMPVHDHAHDHSQGCGWGIWHFIFYFLVFALVFYFLFFALRPSFVLEQCNDSRSHESDEHENREISNGRLLGSAIVAALLLLFVLWIFWWIFSALSH